MLESRLGKLLIIAYTLFTIVVFAVAFSCGLGTCGYYVVFPIMPWAYILTSDFGLSFPWSVYPVLALLNVSTAYVIGAGIEWLYHKFQDRKYNMHREVKNTAKKEKTKLAERGNAVTLTLLGLSVAILAGIGVLYMMGKKMPQPNARSPLQLEEQNASDDSLLTDEGDGHPDWRTYYNEQYDFSISYPPGWAVATGTVLGAPVLTLFDATQEVSPDATFGVHELPVRVSLYPEGLPTGGGGEKKRQSKTIVPIPEASAVDYVLGTGKPWATTVNFEQYPNSWTDWGFAFGRVSIAEEEIAYMRGDVGISPEEFDAYSGDEMVTYGFIDNAEWEIISDMLRSLVFVYEPEEKNAIDVASLIKVASPIEHEQISSPLVVSGEAHGSWYFEASFPVRLVTDDGVVLAEVPATALDDWMQDSLVPFEVSIAFSTTSATSGKLILVRDNPSGLPENDASLEIPVTF